MNKMNKKSRKWFDLAYEHSGGKIPFCFFTKEILNTWLEHFFGRNDSEFFSDLIKRNKRFVETMPSEKEFLEEKRRVLKSAIPHLRNYLPFIDTAITFGSIRGDIDIGLIKYGNFSKEQNMKILYPGERLMAKYPLIDWNSLPVFSSASGNGLTLKIITSRCDDVSKSKLLSKVEKDYIKETISRASILWGDKRELANMTSCLEEYI